MVRVLFFSLLFLSALPGLYAFGEPPEPPNIVVFLCDDLGYGDLSAFGHPHIQTPNLDQLAADGIKLTNFYSAAPVCSPSRVGLLTGRSPNRAGIYDFIIPGHRQRPDNRDLVHLQAHEQTIPGQLKEVGYATCLVGKWHCSSLFNSPKQPQPDHFGFDHWLATHNNAAPSHENPKNFVRNGEEVGELEGFSSQLITNEAIHWLENRNKEQPFFLEVAFHEPHEPVASPADLVEKYRPVARNEDEAQYFANVENVDLAVGRLLKYLEENVEGNTLIIFTSDNGPETLNRYSRAKRSYGSPGALNGMKLWTHEAGFRVPCIMKWMGKTEGFSGESDAVVSALDILPTICSLTGAPLPEQPLDGESMTQLLYDGSFERSKPLIWCFYNALNEQKVALRHGDWKIMASIQADTALLPKLNNVYDGNEEQIREATLTNFSLFNLREDIEESENLTASHPEVLEKMQTLLQREYDALIGGSHIWKRDEFEKLNAAPDWELQFSDPCTDNWQDKWFLDGELATVEQNESGMDLKAGPVNRDNAHHAVLWTKDSFEGDIKIEYNYTRTDSQLINVNILFIQATGTGEEGFDKDITKWNDYRKVPTMSKYYKNMNTLHISYAAFNMNNDDPEADYLRVRQYPVSETVSFDDMEVRPSYYKTGLFLPGVTYKVTIIKTAEKLYMTIVGDDKNRTYSWHLNKPTSITEGRIGLRHMFTRSARYNDFKVYTK